MRGRVIAGKYRLEREIGRGGMGSIWEAFDQSLRRHVALKLMVPHHAQSDDFRQRFEREAMALAQIRDKNIVTIHDYGIDGDCPYIVMELLSGEDLAARLARSERLSPAATLGVVEQIASGLAAATAAGIVHRDLKPANVFVTFDEMNESIKVLDFGLSCSSEERGTDRRGAFIGTPAYMSPEQVRGIAPGHSSDLWALAVIVYRALTGELPFPQRSIGELVVAICTDPLRSSSSLVPDLPPRIDDFFDRALAKDPSRRFQTAQEFVREFARACSRAETTKILVVDDEPDVPWMMKMRFRRMIKRSAYQMFFVDNGEAALEQLRQQPDIDVILADINMPKMDGLTLLEHVPEVAPFSKTVIVSAYGNIANIRRAMNAGAFDFVVKPIDFIDLEATIEKTARHVNEHRKMASSDEENRALRKFVSSTVRDYVGTTKQVASYPSKTTDATVVALEVGVSRAGIEARSPRDFIRALNANFEVAIPVLEARDGVLDRLMGTSLVAVFSGDTHVERALDACRAIITQSHGLARVAGAGSPYASGVHIGVSTGRLLSGCVGSLVRGRLAYTTFGESADEATRLAHAACPGEVLVSDSVVGSCGSFAGFERLEVRPDRIEARPVSCYRWVAVASSDDEQRMETMSYSAQTTQSTVSLEVDTAERTTSNPDVVEQQFDERDP